MEAKVTDRIFKCGDACGIWCMNITALTLYETGDLSALLILHVSNSVQRCLIFSVDDIHINTCRTFRHKITITTLGFQDCEIKKTQF